MAVQAFPSRIVMLSTLAHIWGAINLEDLHFEHRSYSRWGSYGGSLPHC